MIALESKWYQAIQIRRSRRDFVAKPINGDTINYLEQFSTILNSSMDGVRIALVTEKTDDIFRGAVGSYGKVKGAPAYVAFIGDNRDINVQEKVGYTGESFILEATSLGLSTCWVAGFFKPEIVAKKIKVFENESVLAVSPLGYAKEKYSFEEKIMSGFANNHKRKRLDQLCTGLPQKEWTDWVYSALEAARLSPSAVNRQPWKFNVNKESIKVSVDNQNNSYNISKRLDCGISMLHIEVGALNRGVRGEWSYLTTPDVAIFKRVN